MNVGPRRPAPNLSVIGQPPRVDRPVVGLPVTLHATVANTSGDQTVDTVLSVVLDDEQIAQIDLTIPPGQKVTRPVYLTPTSAGIVRGRFELPADAFPDDDAYLFCLNVEPNVRVLVIAPADGEDPADRPNLYLRSALQSPLGPFAHVFHRAPASAFRFPDSRSRRS